MVYDGDQVVNHSCVSDRGYRADVCAHLEKISRHLSETFPDRFAGIHPCGQNTGEWFYLNSWERPLSGYDQATRAAFRQWLKSHGDPQANTAEPPTVDERRAHPNGLLRDPVREKRLLDFARFQQQEMADHVAAMAAACRRGTDGRKLVVFFYGYLFEFPPLSNGAPASGHYALSSLLKGRDIDILCSPISYTDREWIGTAPSMTAAESVERAGILWLNEDDSRTFLDLRKEEHVQEGGLVDLQQTRQVMRRNTAQAAIRGFGTWWMDLPAQGWFNDARIWKEMLLLDSVDAAMLDRREPFAPEIAAIVDEESMCHLPGGSAVLARSLIYDARAALGRCGAPYGQYLLDDVLVGRVPAKLQVLLSAWALSPAKRADPGPAHARRCAGLVLRPRIPVPGPGGRRGDQGGDGIRGQGGQHCDGGSDAHGGRQEARPRGAVGAQTSYPPALQCEGVGGRDAGDVFRRHARRRCAALAKGDRRLRRRASVDARVDPALAKVAGVHLFTEGKATVWAAEGYISLQAHETGPLLLNTGRQGKVVDALDGTVLGDGPEVTLTLKKGEVRVLKYPKF